jgi:hypothetical protein
MYYTKANQDILILILDIKKARTDFKYKRIIKRGLDINYKVDICFYRLKNLLYNILAFSKMAINPIYDY